MRKPEPPRVIRTSGRAAASAARLVPAALALSLAGCVSAPAVVIVDRRTALEQQASGSFRGLEEELEQAGLAPRPAPLTPAQLGAAGVRRGGLEAADSDDESSDAVRTDALLIKRCLGEALDGTLVLTLDPCTGTLDVPLVDQLVERVNRNRRQLWRWLAAQTRGQGRDKGRDRGSDRENDKTDDEVRDAWRKVHLAGLVCGGAYQVTGGGWEIKKC
jgi:hypothetical protein